MKKFILVIYIALHICSMHAQIGTTKIFKPHFILKADPSKLLSPDRNISMSAEARVTKNIGLQVEAAYIFAPTNAAFNPSDSLISYGGFKIVPEIKFYKNHSRKNRDKYFAVQCIIKQVSKEFIHINYLVDSLGNEILISGNYNSSKLIIAPHIMYGVHYKLSKNGKLFWEPNFGIGVRKRTVQNNAVPKYRPERNFFSDYNNYLLLGVTANVKLCYRF